MSREIDPDLRKALSRLVDDKLEEYAIEVEEINMNGENFLGEIVFLSLKGKRSEEELRFVIKRSRKSMQQSERFNSIYATEIRFYGQIWPVLHEFQQQRHSNGFDKIAKFYASIGGEVEQLILEDLRQHEFKLHDKTRPLNHQHYELIFRNYGIFHAISFAFREENPEEFRKLTEGLETLDDFLRSNQYEALFKTHLRSVIELFDREEDAGIKDALSKQLEDPMKHIVPQTDERVLVLTHGDCWSNNLLFKYNDRNEPIDLRMIDFQLVNVNSPVKDLSHTFYSGAPKELLDRLEHYLRVYHESFTETLEKLGCNPGTPLTFDRLKEEWARYCTFGFCLGLLLWNMKFVDKDHIPDLESEEKKVAEGLELNMYVVAPDKVEDYNRAVKGLVVHMYENGFI